jgi:hypothetical protein
MIAGPTVSGMVKAASRATERRTVKEQRRIQERNCGDKGLSARRQLRLTMGKTSHWIVRKILTTEIAKQIDRLQKRQDSVVVGGGDWNSLAHGSRLCCVFYILFASVWKHPRRRHSSNS